MAFFKDLALRYFPRSKVAQAYKAELIGNANEEIAAVGKELKGFGIGGVIEMHPLPSPEKARSGDPVTPKRRKRTRDYLTRKENQADLKKTAKLRDLSKSTKAAMALAVIGLPLTGGYLHHLSSMNLAPVEQHTTSLPALDGGQDVFTAAEKAQITEFARTFLKELFDERSGIPKALKDGGVKNIFPEEDLAKYPSEDRGKAFFSSKLLRKNSEKFEITRQREH